MQRAGLNWQSSALIFSDAILPCGGTVAPQCRTNDGRGSGARPSAFRQALLLASRRSLRNGQSTHEAEAIVPLVPVHLRPKRGLENYHILWEAEWTRVVPRDPMLLRRIG